jgi:hypothetical protein
MKLASVIVVSSILAGQSGRVSGPVTTPARGGSSDSDSVWFWFAACGGPMMTVEIQFDHRILSQTSFPICKAPRGSAYGKGEQGAISYTFNPGRSIIWEGYRNNHDTTPANQRVTGDIWQAGADAEDLLIGISYSVPDRIAMNTIHIAYPARTDTSEIARGLFVITYPGRAHSRFAQVKKATKG